MQETLSSNVLRADVFSADHNLKFRPRLKQERFGRSERLDSNVLDVASQAGVERRWGAAALLVAVPASIWGVVAILGNCELCGTRREFVNVAALLGTIALSGLRNCVE